LENAFLKGDLTGKGVHSLREAEGGGEGDYRYTEQEREEGIFQSSREGGRSYSISVSRRKEGCGVRVPRLSLASERSVLAQRRAILQEKRKEGGEG